MLDEVVHRDRVEAPPGEGRVREESRVGLETLVRCVLDAGAVEVHADRAPAALCGSRQHGPRSAAQVEQVARGPIALQPPQAIEEGLAVLGRGLEVVGRRRGALVVVLGVERALIEAWVHEAQAAVLAPDHLEPVALQVRAGAGSAAKGAAQGPR